MNNIFPAFPKIFTIGGHDYIRDIFDGPVEVTEKVDGSQFAFGVFDGELMCRSKGKQQHVEQPDKMFEPGVEYLLSVKDHMEEGLVYYAEYLKGPHHNTLHYERTPRNHFAVFGIMDTKNANVFMDSHTVLQFAAEAIGVDVVPLVYQGEIEQASEVLDMIERESYLGGAKIEGVVIVTGKP